MIVSQSFGVYEVHTDAHRRRLIKSFETFDDAFDFSLTLPPGDYMLLWPNGHVIRMMNLGGDA